MKDLLWALELVRVYGPKSKWLLFAASAKGRALMWGVPGIRRHSPRGYSLIRERGGDFWCGRCSYPVTNEAVNTLSYFGKHYLYISNNRTKAFPIGNILHDTLAFGPWPLGP